jgi:hypothetical protein
VPKKKKRPIDWTTDEAMKKLFPKKVRDELKRIAHEKDDKDSPSQDNDSTDEV